MIREHDRAAADRFLAALVENFGPALIEAGWTPPGEAPAATPAPLDGMWIQVARSAKFVHACDLILAGNGTVWMVTAVELRDSGYREITAARGTRSFTVKKAPRDVVTVLIPTIEHTARTVATEELGAVEIEPGEETP